MRNHAGAAEAGATTLREERVRGAVEEPDFRRWPCSQGASTCAGTPSKKTGKGGSRPMLALWGSGVGRLVSPCWDTGMCPRSWGSIGWLARRRPITVAPSCPSSRDPAVPEEETMSDIIIEAIAPADPELAEEWVRRSDDPDVLGVGSSRWAEGGDWPWRVEVAMASLIRAEPLQGELRDRVTAALEAAPGVARVIQEDPEVWIVSGDPTGPASSRRPLMSWMTWPSGYGPACGAGFRPLRPDLRPPPGCARRLRGPSGGGPRPRPRRRAHHVRRVRRRGHKRASSSWALCGDPDVPVWFIPMSADIQLLNELGVQTRFKLLICVGWDECAGGLLEALPEPEGAGSRG